MKKGGVAKRSKEAALHPCRRTEKARDSSHGQRYAHYYTRCTLHLPRYIHVFILYSTACTNLYNVAVIRTWIQENVILCFGMNLSQEEAFLTKKKHVSSLRHPYGKGNEDFCGLYVNLKT